jgi:hypothetical protein
MMVQGLISNNSIPGIGYALDAKANGKLSVPVAPVSLVYSYFKNVSGVPAPEGSQGVAITKLNILDVLIEQMNQIKKTQMQAGIVQIPEDRLDALIESYKTQIREAVEARAIMPYTPAPLAQTGAILNLTA